jgi:FlgD Ig-like domain
LDHAFLEEVSMRTILGVRTTWGGVAAVLVALAMTLAAVPARSQCPIPNPDAEMGDAPEGAPAYPDLGVAGRFPTCIGGPSGCVQHDDIGGGPPNNAFFGPNLDYELDGNAGVCPPPPYENDECYGPLDGDAGLVMPTGFTFSAAGPPYHAVTCSGQPPQSLAHTCGTARWGTDIDIELTNHHTLGLVVPVPTTCYLNVLIDLDRSGSWDPFVPTACGPLLPEHVVQNLLVPSGFTGLASQLPGIPDFQVGSDSGYVWVRFTISPNSVPLPWDGSGHFEGGETEDYMLHIDGNSQPAEYGDAPQGVPAYPPMPVIGQFPTCTQTGAFVQHPGPGMLFFGPFVDYEGDGNANDCAFQVYDNDECFGGDAGIVVPRPYTIRRTPGPQIEPCTPPATDLGTECTQIQWGTGLDMQITNNLPTDVYFNMLADWDQDGMWTSLPGNCTGAMNVPEQVVVNLPVPSGFSGLLSQLNPPQAFMGHRGYVWTRFTLSTAPASPLWDGSGNMGEGETEDYLLHVAAETTDTEDFRFGHLHVGEASPNPTRTVTRVELDLPASSPVSVAVYDARGQRVRDLGMQTLARGRSRIDWDGARSNGRRVAAGMYFMRFDIGGEVFTRRVLLLN